HRPAPQGREAERHLSPDHRGRPARNRHPGRRVRIRDPEDRAGPGRSPGSVGGGPARGASAPQGHAGGGARQARRGGARGDAEGMTLADESCVMVIFGASGDLTKRKLVPALWSLFQSRVLPEPFAVIGVSRTEMSNEVFRTHMREAISDFARVQPPSPRVWDRFAQTLFYYTADPADAGIYPGLGDFIKQVERERGTSGNRLFYLSTPPSLYPHIVNRLGEAGFQRGESADAWVRIVIEKPFGRDLASSRALNHVV